MKNTILNVMRSLFTSFLFLIMVPVIFAHIVLTSIQINNISIPENIDINIIKTRLNIEDMDEITTEYLDEFLKNYLKYLFKGGSYPTVNSKGGTYLINKITKQIDIEYSDVLIIRNITSLIYNNSVYLIVNFLLFVILISCIIIQQNFIKGFKSFSLFTVIASLISLFVFLSMYIYIKNINTIFLSLILNIIDTYYFKSIINISLIYSGLFFMIYLLIKFYYYKKEKKYNYK